MYSTSQKWKENIYNNVQCAVNIYIDDVLIDPTYILELRKGGNVFEEELTLGSTPSQYIEMKLYKAGLPTTHNKLRIEYGILINNALTVEEVSEMLVGDLNETLVQSLLANDNSFEMIPIGTYNIDDFTDNYDNTLTIKALDNMIKFDADGGYYDASELINRKGYATLGEIARDICNKKGVELGSTSFLNSDKKVALYDNTITARQYIGMIAEDAGGFAFIGRDGKLYFREIYEDETEIPFEYFAEPRWGEEHKITRVSYESGTISHSFGDDTGNTLWISQDNLYVDEELIKSIYDKIKDFTAYSFTGRTIIDPAIDIGDKIIIDGKPVIYQGEMNFNMRFIAEISSNIQIKAREQTTTKTETQTVINRRVKSDIDLVKGTIEDVVEEQSEYEEKLAQITQDVDGISQKVKSTRYFRKEKTQLENLYLDDIAEGKRYITEFIIYGNSEVFNLDEITIIASTKPRNYGENIYITTEDNNDIATENNKEIIAGARAFMLDWTKLKLNGALRSLRIGEDTYYDTLMINQDGIITVTRKISVKDNGELYLLDKEVNEVLTEEFVLPSARETYYFVEEIGGLTYEATYITTNSYEDIFATKEEMGSEIKQTKEKIELTVNRKLENYSTTTEMNSAIKQKADSITGEVTKKIENIQIGGRNLYLGTSKEWSDWITPNVNTNNITTYFYDCKDTSLFEKDAEFTISFDVEFSGVTKGTGGSFRLYSQWCFTVNGSNTGWSEKPVTKAMNITEPPADGVYHYTATGKLSANYTNATKVQFAPRADYWGSGKYRIRNVKLEKGNKVTDWSPAPEDYPATNEIIAKLNLAIKDGQGVINISGNQVTIDSDNFELSADGKVVCKGIKINGGLLSLEDDGTSGKIVAFKIHSSLEAPTWTPEEPIYDVSDVEIYSDGILLSKYDEFNPDGVGHAGIAVDADVGEVTAISSNYRFAGTADTFQSTLYLGGKTPDQVNEIEAIASDNESSIVVKEDDCQTKITGTNIQIPKNGTRGYGLANSDGVSIIRDHNNSNVTVDATGGVLYLGYQDTTSIDILNGKAAVDQYGNFVGGRFLPTSRASGVYMDQYGNLVAPNLTSGNWHISKNGSNVFELAWSDNYITVAGGFRTKANLTADGSLYLDNGYIRSKKTYDNDTVTNAPNMYITSSGNFRRTTNTSSKRYKEDIKDVENEELNPEKLYDLPVRQFKYKKEYLQTEDDPRYNKDLVGLIAEEVAQYYPCAVDYEVDENGNRYVENWNEKYMIPAMLKLIQDLNQRVKILEEKER